MLNRQLLSFVCALLLSTFSASILAAAIDGGASTREESATNRRANFHPPAQAVVSDPLTGKGDLNSGTDAGVLVFSAPPRETPAEGARIYEPIADYLSRVIGKKVVYRHPGNWLVYQTEMLHGSYDFEFDGPHFNSWRSAHMQHHILAKLAEEHVFAVIVRKNETPQVPDLKHLVGKIVCGMNPPNLGTLAVLSNFDNPARQPVIVNTTGWNRIYQSVVNDKQCVAGILPLANLAKYDGGANFTRIIYQTKVMPNQGFSAGPRVSPEDQEKIRAALTSPQAAAVTAPLRAMYGSDRGFVPATKGEYAGLAVYLKDVWGYAR